MSEAVSATRIVYPEHVAGVPLLAGAVGAWNGYLHVALFGAVAAFAIAYHVAATRREVHA